VGHRVGVKHLHHVSAEGKKKYATRLRPRAKEQSQNKKREGGASSVEPKKEGLTGIEKRKGIHRRET